MIISAGRVRSAFLWIRGGIFMSGTDFLGTCMEPISKLKIFFINCAIFLACAIFKPGFIA